MAIYPGAVWKPTPHGGKTPRNKQGRGILHVAVSARRSYPPDSANATWHMYVAHDGYCEQYVDSDHRAYASGDANDDAFQIETAGGLGTSAALNAERWTPAAVERLADIMAWLQRVDGTPLQLLPDSKPGRRGWGPHRLGIKHSAGPRPGWWQPGGEVWTKHLGKECPGDAKVAQVPLIIARAQQIQNGDDDMPSAQEIAEAVWSSQINAREGVGPAPARDFLQHAAVYATRAAGLQSAVDKLAAAVAAGRDDITADDVKRAVSEGIQEAGAALRAAEGSTRLQS